MHSSGSSSLRYLLTEIVMGGFWKSVSFHSSGYSCIILLYLNHLFLHRWDMLSDILFWWNFLKRAHNGIQYSINFLNIEFIAFEDLWISIFAPLSPCIWLALPAICLLISSISLLYMMKMSLASCTIRESWAFEISIPDHTSWNSIFCKYN